MTWTTVYRIVCISLLYLLLVTIMLNLYLETHMTWRVYRITETDLSCNGYLVFLMVTSSNVRLIFPFEVYLIFFIQDSL